MDKKISKKMVFQQKRK